MISIICGTNRKNSVSGKVARQIFQLLKAKHPDVKLLLLEELPPFLANSDNYRNKPPELIRLQEEFLLSTDKFFFVLPEYNGSFPGAVKLLVDNCDVKKCWYHKKACLLGIASGHAGNIMGLDQFMTIMNHVKVNVLHNKVKISHIEREIDEDGMLMNEGTLNKIEQQLDQFLAF